MKKFMLLHVGFEKPTPEIMAAGHPDAQLRVSARRCGHKRNEENRCPKLHQARLASSREWRMDRFQ